MSEDIQYLFSKMAFFVICLHFHPFADVSFRKQTTHWLYLLTDPSGSQQRGEHPLWIF